MSDQPPRGLSFEFLLERMLMKHHELMKEDAAVPSVVLVDAVIQKQIRSMENMLMLRKILKARDLRDKIERGSVLGTRTEGGQTE